MVKGELRGTLGSVFLKVLHESGSRRITSYNVCYTKLLRGSIVNTVSDALYAGMPDKVTYSVTKAGIGAMTRNVASRFGKQGISYNFV